MTTSIAASKARSSLYRLIEKIPKSHPPIMISGKCGSAVLVSADVWQAIQETLHLLSVPGMRESIRNARVPSPSSHFDELKKTEFGIKSGNVKFVDWVKAKQSIRRRAK